MTNYQKNKYFAEQEAEIKRVFLDYCRPATLQEYATWFAGWYAKNPIKIRLSEDNFSNMYYLEKEPEFLPAACGALSFSVIIPGGSFRDKLAPRPLFIEEGPSHNDLYFLSNFTTNAYMPTLYADVRPLLFGSQHG